MFVTRIFIIFLSIFFISFLSGEINYSIHDIGTLQTHSSQAIAINNQGQILGWYSVDGTIKEKYFFIRNCDGSFHSISADTGMVITTIKHCFNQNKNEEAYCVDVPQNHRIEWKYLTDTGKAYGFVKINGGFPSLFVWEPQNGVLNLGNLPGPEITAINNSGQVLIKSIVENQDGKKIHTPVVWENGNIIKLTGLKGDAGILSEESYGFAMNNKGEVVGQSLAYTIYKDQIYKQIHAVKWVNGQTIDLHGTIPKANRSSAMAINDRGDVLIDRETNSNMDRRFLLKSDGKSINHFDYVTKINNNGDSFYSLIVKNENGTIVFNYNKINDYLKNDSSSIWFKFMKIVSVNDHGEIIAEGETIYGEKHAMLLKPVKTK